MCIYVFKMCFRYRWFVYLYICLLIYLFTCLSTNRSTSFGLAIACNSSLTKTRFKTCHMPTPIRTAGGAKVGWPSWCSNLALTLGPRESWVHKDKALNDTKWHKMTQIFQKRNEQNIYGGMLRVWRFCVKNCFDLAQPSFFHFLPSIQRGIDVGAVGCQEVAKDRSRSPKTKATVQGCGRWDVAMLGSNILRSIGKISTPMCQVLSTIMMWMRCVIHRMQFRR